MVSFMDNGTIYDKGLYDHAFALAKERNIPCQTKTRIAGGNNAHVLHTVKSGRPRRGGVRTGKIYSFAV